MQSELGWFITGTDTGVGKTVIAAGIAAALRARGVDAGVMKPIQTGAERGPDGLTSEDTDFLIRATQVDDDPRLVCPCRLEPPLAPLVAARISGQELNPSEILTTFRKLAVHHSHMVVEGAGGIAVPIRVNYLMSDLARDMRLPLIIVARPGLGTLNHTFLTLEHARSRGLVVSGVVLNGCASDPDLAERTNPGILEEWSCVPVLAQIPHVQRPDVLSPPLRRCFDDLVSRLLSTRAGVTTVEEG